MSDLVIDTDVVSVGVRQNDLFKQHYAPAIAGRRCFVSFMTIAEIQFGMLNRTWRVQEQQNMLQHLSRHYVQYGVTQRLCEA